MGIRNSSLTRVKPLFDNINKDVQKLNSLVEFFAGKKDATISSILEIRYGNDEKKLPPPKSLLTWMIQNLHKLKTVPNHGSKSIGSATTKKRQLLFSGDLKIKNEAINLVQMSSPVPKSAWYIFEGYTSPDIYIETDDSIFIGEAKRTEKDITTKTQWLDPRDQLIRHVDSLLDQPKKIYSFYLLEEDSISKGCCERKMVLYADKDYFRKNLPHREDHHIERAHKSFIGYTLWDDLAAKFDITFPDTVPLKK